MKFIVTQNEHDSAIYSDGKEIVTVKFKKHLFGGLDSFFNINGTEVLAITERSHVLSKPTYVINYQRLNDPIQIIIDNGNTYLIVNSTRLSVIPEWHFLKSSYVFYRDDIKICTVVPPTFSIDRPITMDFAVDDQDETFIYHLIWFLQILSTIIQTG